jgi:hypothetical protein
MKTKPSAAILDRKSIKTTEIPGVYGMMLTRK